MNSCGPAAPAPVAARSARTAIARTMRARRYRRLALARGGRRRRRLGLDRGGTMRADGSVDGEAGRQRRESRINRAEQGRRMDLRTRVDVPVCICLDAEELADAGRRVLGGADRQWADGSDRRRREVLADRAAGARIRLVDVLLPDERAAAVDLREPRHELRRVAVAGE